MKLDATESDIDDLIITTNPLNKPTRHQATFRAYFTPTSDQEFLVAPKYGELQPMEEMALNSLLLLHLLSMDKLDLTNHLLKLMTCIGLTKSKAPYQV
ncbi:unnamed protein product (macronuclear) [Paramecium tetraurelia]|uniref:Uncharacterized protein n=1 Tax=Paramecium tetraurelia TaxID=5888 RepID=A0D030_PARTE|nr:uncharacterized protein GSPATT00039145001 [Paramecium tetraurelia]CAK76397.1 unnamed protein product [Paramecium tetraurelia]|eukprot:XP_001443794.1 hypothetical protein (macronuclear) [Paramecium tetraurelia strain d4-2]